MFKSWSLIKAATACRCMSCLSARAVRPQVGAHNGSRRSLQFKHLTTLFYSSMIATAAAIDVKTKRSRRAQWDRAIAAAELDLQSSAEEPQHYSLASPESKDAFLLKLPFERSRRSRSSIYANGKRLRTNDQHEVSTPKKQRTFELSIKRLAIRFLLAFPDAFNPDGHYMQEYTWSGPEVRTELLALDKEALISKLSETEAHLHDLRGANAWEVKDILHEALPNFGQYAYRRPKNQQSLSKSLVHLFQIYTTEERPPEQLIAKVVDALLVSPKAPNIVVFNMLIHRLSKMKLYELADMTIDSLFESHARPDEITIDTILNHYIMKRDSKSFNVFLNKIKGRMGGLELARPDVTTSGVGASRLKKVGDKIVQLNELDSRIYQSIIKGCLAFKQYSSAREWYKAMLKHDCEPDIHLHLSFLIANVMSRSWEAGLLAWSSIQSGLSQANGLSSSYIFQWEKDAYRWMLRLCKACDKSTFFESFYAEALQKGISRHFLLGSEESRKPQIFTEETDRLRALHRRVGIVHYRLNLLTQDLRIWTWEALAAKLIMGGHSLGSVRERFKEHEQISRRTQWDKLKALVDLSSESSKKSRIRIASRSETEPAIITQQLPLGLVDAQPQISDVKSKSSRSRSSRVPSQVRHLAYQRTYAPDQGQRQVISTSELSQDTCEKTSGVFAV